MGELRKIKKDTNPVVIEVLERLLEGAKSGELSAIAYSVDMGGEMECGYVGAGLDLNMLGELRLLEHRLASEIVDR